MNFSAITYTQINLYQFTPQGQKMKVMNDLNPPAGCHISDKDGGIEKNPLQDVAQVSNLRGQVRDLSYV